MQKEVPLLCNLWDHTYEHQNPSDFKKIARDPPPKKLLESFESSKLV